MKTSVIIASIILAFALAIGVAWALGAKGVFLQSGTGIEAGTLTNPIYIQNV